MRIRSSARSDVGRVREGNEDRLLVDQAVRLFAVADGVGGELAGERAAERFVDTVRAAAPRFAALADEGGSAEEIQDAALRLLTEVFDEASRRVYEEGQADPSARGMATTGVLVWIDRGRG